MNNLLKHLASEAGFYLYDDEPTIEDPDCISWEMNYSDENLENLYKLVIHECVKVLELEKSNKVSTEKLIQKIYDHFEKYNQM
jgi:hypothetical protein